MGRSPCCQQEGLKKGPWTPEEDQKLIAYVKEHGHGNWRALPKKCGLLRCGKSCRLRWTNYLRPDIKRGLFSDSEEQKIIQLHALVGNKWAFIASQLPKRTDNEIKNYWNTVLKKRVERGLSSLIRHQSREWDEKLLGKQLKFSHTNSKVTSMTSMSCHLVQWESARLEAEARLLKESKHNKTSKPSLNRSAFPSYYTPDSKLHANQNSTLGSFSCLDQNIVSPLSSLPPSSKSIINSTCTLLSLLSSSIVMNSTASPSKSLVSPSKPPASKLSSPQGSLNFALKLGEDGKLSWNTQELSFRRSPTPQSSSPQQNSHLDCNLVQEELSSPLGSKRDSTNMGVIYNPLDMPNIFNLHEILFEVENSCSYGVKTWEGEKDETLESDDATCSKDVGQDLDQYGHHVNGTFSNKSTNNVCDLDLENLHFFHFDTLLVGTQHSSNNFLITDKETMCNSSSGRILSNPTSIVS